MPMWAFGELALSGAQKDSWPIAVVIGWDYERILTSIHSM